MRRKTTKLESIMKAEKVTGHIVNWLRDYAEAAGVNAFEGDETRHR